MNSKDTAAVERIAGIVADMPGAIPQLHFLTLLVERILEDGGQETVKLLELAIVRVKEGRA